jgi:deazaflavin-dependent oxidoreductase (nitroreductase family)
MHDARPRTALNSVESAVNMAGPSPILARALRLPVHLYDIGAGRILGRRFLLLTHRGRRSGRLYRTMLEVVGWDPERREAIVMSGFGVKANWRLNALAGGAVEVQIAGLRFTPQVRSLEPEEAGAVLADYERRNRAVGPIVRAVLSRLAGFRYDGSTEARNRLVEKLPLVAFSPKNGGAVHSSMP